VFALTTTKATAQVTHFANGRTALASNALARDGLINSLALQLAALANGTTRFRHQQLLILRW
jgi:hypothetical protein